ncbi:hypothetical protein [Pimelobacter sp. 30-1]|uniref:DUF6881 domain-containing protein n=1 Tax=Pimelobacter sp. 30-1 TaxID=2004991 RepID=UPI00217060AD|nr:hypothetical protein [Pimelobacter sp. 30-1]
MRYQRVHWRHGLAEFPVVLFSEIDGDGWETRKVDEYADGHLDLAGNGIETGRTFLGLDRVPSLDEINDDRQFLAEEITAEEFDTVWSKAMEWFELT